MKLEICARNVKTDTYEWTEIEDPSEISSLTCIDCTNPAAEVTNAGIGPDGSPLAWATCKDCHGEIITKDFFNNAG